MWRGGEWIDEGGGRGENDRDEIETFESSKHKTTVHVPEMVAFLTAKVEVPTQTFAEKEFFIFHRHALLELAEGNKLRDPISQHMRNFLNFVQETCCVLSPCPGPPSQAPLSPSPLPQPPSAPLKKNLSFSSTFSSAEEESSLLLTPLQPH